MLGGLKAACVETSVPGAPVARAGGARLFTAVQDIGALKVRRC